MATRFEMSEEAKKILIAVKMTEPGSKLKYEALQNLTGVNDLARLRGYAYTAFRHAFKEWGMKFKSERGIGYARLDENGKNSAVALAITGINRRAKRTNRLHDAVAFNALDALGKLTHVTNATQLAEIKKAASRARRNKIAKVASDNKTVEAMIDGTLELFRRKRA